MKFLPVTVTAKSDQRSSDKEKPQWLFQRMTPIIKVVGDFCNLKCVYCFYNQRDQLTPRVMSYELLEKFIKQYLDAYLGNLQFIWHGGEPLMAGLDFFQRTLKFQERYQKPHHVIRNLIQTNATLINDEWAHFFKEHGFRVGVSIDGNRKSHDHFRLNHAGSGSFNAVMRGVQILKHHGVIPGIIQTLTREILGNDDEDFMFFTKTLGVRSIGINNFFNPVVMKGQLAIQNISNTDLTAFLKRNIDRILKFRNQETIFREWENFFAGVLTRKASNCSFNGTCTRYFCLEYDGRIYPCDRFSGRRDLLFGNLTKQSLPEILTSEERRRYAETVSAIHPECASCRWYNACHNGCPHHRVGGIGGKYYYCETRKTIFSYMEEILMKYKVPSNNSQKAAVEQLAVSQTT